MKPSGLIWQSRCENSGFPCRAAGWLLCVAVLLAFVPVRAWADDLHEYDQWYVVLIDDQRAGWMHAASRIVDDEIHRTEDTYIVVRRGPVQLPIRVTLRTVETRDYQLRRVEMSQQMAAQEMKQVMVVDGRNIDMTSTIAGNTTRNRLTLPEGEWLTPGAAAKQTRDAIKAGEKELTFRTVDASTGLRVVTSTMKWVGEENIEVFGRSVPALVWDVTTDIMPGLVVRSYVDDKGLPLKTTMTLAGMRLTMLAADEQLARTEIDAPELMARTLVEPVGRIANPRRLRRAVYELSLVDATENDRLTLTSGGVQRVEQLGPDRVRVTVDLDKPLDPAGDEPDETHLAASAMVNHKDPKIRELMRQALGDDGAKLARAEKARRLAQFVAGYVESKNLNVGYASASETARTATGDCTEHAVLLAALLRAADIPSRTVSGLIYVDCFLDHAEVFGYHMWTQAWLVDEATGKGRWVDLDATLDDGGFDAAHIMIATNSHADGRAANDLIQLTPLIGRLRIEVK